MIDFRYHLVSIIAIFLALAVGLVVGATTLTGPTETALNSAEHHLSQENAALRAQNASLNQQVGADQAFAQGNSDRLLAGLLTGHKVVLVVPPNTDAGMVSGVTTALQEAGATVTGRVMLQPSFFDFSAPTESNLNNLAGPLASEAGVKLGPSSGSTVSGQQAAAAVLAPALLSKSSTDPGLAAATSRTILSQFNGYLQVSPTTGATLGTASLAVLFTPAGISGGGAQVSATNQALDALATQLHSYSLGTVVAGSLSAIPNGAITSLGGPLPASTVDNADTAPGQVMVAQALAQLVQGKAPAAYGVEPGAAPSPAPTPSATPTPTSTPSSKGKTK